MNSFITCTFVIFYKMGSSVTRGESKFKEMVVGSDEILREYKKKLGSLVAENL